MTALTTAALTTAAQTPAGATLTTWLAAPAAEAVQHRGFLSPTGVEVVFVLVGLVTLGAAVLTVTTRQLVHAALWLVVALGGIAVEYLLLTAEFIAWVQVLIYVGSVVVLLLFGLMLTRAPIGRSPDADSGNRPVALAVALATAATLVWVVVDAFRTTWIDLDQAVQGSTQVTGEALFSSWVLPFEALSVLLLAALIGAIVLSRRSGREDDAADSPAGDPAGPDTPPSTGSAGAPANSGSPATGPGEASAPTVAPGEAAPPRRSRAASTPGDGDTPGPEGTR
ncbi:NADH-quinone oxidoreductase subunit J [Streptomyces sp. NPDC058373]|uniref:NADH-quinone oxidoreductase subunit J family protein n=1 Tax=Streptomyces sp. NPDC058373 TaxID=3346465 RepID=UPI0036641887